MTQLALMPRGVDVHYVRETPPPPVTVTVEATGGQAPYTFAVGRAAQNLELSEPIVDGARATFTVTVKSGHAASTFAEVAVTDAAHAVAVCHIGAKGATR